MITVSVCYKIGIKENAPKITKRFLVAKFATVRKIMNELAFGPKLMQGARLEDSYDTLIFSLDANRKSEGRR